MWLKIQRDKLIVSEPRSGRKEDFESAMSDFYNIVRESSPSRTTRELSRVVVATVCMYM